MDTKDRRCTEPPHFGKRPYDHALAIIIHFLDIRIARLFAQGHSLTSSKIIRINARLEFFTDAAFRRTTKSE